MFRNIVWIPRRTQRLFHIQVNSSGRARGTSCQKESSQCWRVRQSQATHEPASKSLLSSILFLALTWIRRIVVQLEPGVRRRARVVQSHHRTWHVDIRSLWNGAVPVRVIDFIPVWKSSKVDMREDHFFVFSHCANRVCLSASWCPLEISKATCMTLTLVKVDIQVIVGVEIQDIQVKSLQRYPRPPDSYPRQSRCTGNCGRGNTRHSSKVPAKIDCISFFKSVVFSFFLNFLTMAAVSQPHFTVLTHNCLLSFQFFFGKLKSIHLGCRPLWRSIRNMYLKDGSTDSWWFQLKWRWCLWRTQVEFQNHKRFLPVVVLWNRAFQRDTEMGHNCDSVGYNRPPFDNCLRNPDQCPSEQRTSHSVVFFIYFLFFNAKKLLDEQTERTNLSHIAWEQESTASFTFCYRSSSPLKFFRAEKHCGKNDVVDGSGFNLPGLSSPM